MKNSKSIKKRHKSKKAISIPFEWIFAMIIGAIILFMAIYFAVNGLNTGNKYKNTEVIAMLESYLSPYETGLGSGQFGEIHFSAKSKIYFDRCDPPNSANIFGRQSISFNQVMFDKYQKKGEYVELKSKYVFANETTEGKDFYIVSIPFFMAYKVSDIFIIYTDQYCFVNAPNEVKDLVIDGLELKNINFSDDVNCKGIKVCFDYDNKACQIKVRPNNQNSYTSGTVEKYDSKGKPTEVNYVGNLMYGAIFSSEKLYECNVKRLMKKFQELGKVYIDKISIMKLKGCSSNAQGILSSTMQSAEELESSSGLIEIGNQIEEIKKINDGTQLGCMLFSSE